MTIRVLVAIMIVTVAARASADCEPVANADAVASRPDRQRSSLVMMSRGCAAKPSAS